MLEDVISLAGKHACGSPVGEPLQLHRLHDLMAHRATCVGRGFGFYSGQTLVSYTLVFICSVSGCLIYIFMYICVSSDVCNTSGSAT